MKGKGGGLGMAGMRIGGGNVVEVEQIVQVEDTEKLLEMEQKLEKEKQEI